MVRHVSVLATPGDNIVVKGRKNLARQSRSRGWARRSRSYAAFITPPQISGQPKLECWSIKPASAGVVALARLRGTFVMLAAAARSSGSTHAHHQRLPHRHVHL